jgi:polysaccharide chain length determinant protein (PEP-CTERM system associated)
MIPGKAYTPEDIVKMVWRRKWLLLAPLVVGLFIATVYAYSLPDKYRSDTLILVIPQRVPESYVRSTITTRIEDRLQAMRQQIMSRTRLEGIVQSFNLYPELRQRGIMEDVIEQMRRDIQVDIVRGDAFRVSYISDDPRTAMRVAERLAGLFIEENLQDRAVLAESTNQFLESQLEEARRRLVEHERKLEDFRRQYSGQLPDQVQANLQVLSNTQMQLQSLIESAARDRDRRLILERQLADLTSPEATSLPAALELPADPTQMPSGSSAAQQLEVARAALRQMELRLRPEHPDIVRMQRVIRELEEKAEAEALQRPLSPGGAPARPTSPAEAARRAKINELRAELVLLDRGLQQKQAEEARLRGLANTYQARVEAVPSRESELTALMRDYNTISGQYTSLLSKHEDSKIAANLERRQGGEQFRIIDAARIPERPFSPDRQWMIIFGAVLGLAFGGGIGALLEYRDRTLKNEADVLVALSLPVLATIPRMMTAAERRLARRRRVLVSAATLFVVVLGAAFIMWRFVHWRGLLGL